MSHVRVSYRCPLTKVLMIPMVLGEYMKFSRDEHY